MGVRRRQVIADPARGALSDLDAAAAATRTATKRCVTCLDTAVAAKVREFVARRRAGTLDLSIEGLRREVLAKHYGYRFTRAALERHVRDCEGGL